MPPLTRPRPRDPHPVRAWVPEDFDPPAPRPAAPARPPVTPAPAAPAPPAPAPAARPPRTAAPDAAPAPAPERTQGYQAGYAEGFATGQREAYAKGYGEGHQEGYREGRAAGYQDGRPAGYEAGSQEAGALVATLRTLLDALAATTGALHQALAEDLLALSVEIARKMVGHALQTRPEQIFDVLQSALAALPQARARIHLHPADLALVRAHLPEHPALTGHRLIEDPALSRGGCTLDTDTTQLDASVPTRWARILGGFPAPLLTAPPPAAGGDA